jgi:hypothetical protein
MRSCSPFCRAPMKQLQRVPNGIECVGTSVSGHQYQLAYLCPIRLNDHTMHGAFMVKDEKLLT